MNGKGSEKELWRHCDGVEEEDLGGKEESGWARTRNGVLGYGLVQLLYIHSYTTFASTISQNRIFLCTAQLNHAIKSSRMHENNMLYKSTNSY